MLFLMTISEFCISKDFKYLIWISYSSQKPLILSFKFCQDIDLLVFESFIPPSQSMITSIPSITTPVEPTNCSHKLVVKKLTSPLPESQGAWAVPQLFKIRGRGEEILWASSVFIKWLCSRINIFWENAATWLPKTVFRNIFLPCLSHLQSTEYWNIHLF